jgi:multiple sugar transport system permease protein
MDSDASRSFAPLRCRWPGLRWRRWPIFTFLHSWNLYLEPIVFLSTPSMFTLPQALTQYTDAYGGPMWNIQLAAATLTALPVLIVFVLAQKQFVEGLAHTGLK